MTATAPPAAQAPRTSYGESSRSATIAGLMKMPEPMIPPMTTIVASKGPRARLKDTTADSPSVLAVHIEAGFLDPAQLLVECLDRGVKHRAVGL